jgi:hypothetical protein
MMKIEYQVVPGQYGSLYAVCRYAPGLNDVWTAYFLLPCITFTISTLGLACKIDYIRSRV